MKKIFISLLLLFNTLVLCSCSKSISLKENDMVIVDQNKIYGMNIIDDHLEINESMNRKKGDVGLWYYNNLFFENEDAYFTKTSTDKNLNVWIEKIDKDNFKVTRQKHTSIDTNCALLTENYYYVVNNFITNLKIDVYDLDLDLVKTIEFKYDDSSSMYPTDLIEVNGDIYMLCGIIPKSSEYGYTQNYILKLDKDFNLLNQFDLGEYQGSFFSFVYGNDRIYLTHTTSNLNNEGMALGNNEIWVFDLNENRVLDEKIMLSHSFPFDMHYDKQNNNLIISHGENGPTPNHVWTIYDLDTYQEIIFPIDYASFDDMPVRNASLAYKDNQYYLLFPDQLWTFDLTDYSSRVYKLDELGIEEAVLITVN